MTICRKCGTSNKDDRKFCTFCHELLVADPVELAKREAAKQKKLQKELKKLQTKHKRWKRALLMLIPIGVLDLIDLALCLDLALIGIGKSIGDALGVTVQAFIGTTIRLFGNLVYTSLLVEYAVRGLELAGALGVLLAAFILAIVMIKRMIKWRKYRKNGDPREQELLQQLNMQQFADQAEQFEAAEQDEMSEQELREALMNGVVSYQALQDLNKQREQYAMPAPVNVTDCKALYEALLPCLWEYDADSVRRILSAMCSSRMLLCCAGALDGASIFDNMSRVFGVKATQLVCSGNSEGQSYGAARILLRRDPENGLLTHTQFVNALYTATFSPKNICFSGVSGIGAKECESVFAPLLPYVKLPSDNVALYLGKPADGVQDFENVSQGKMLLPSNVWLLNVLPEQDHAPDVGGKLGQYCATIYLRNSQNVNPPEGAQSVLGELPSIDALERAVETAEGRNYLSEEMWKVIDKIEQQVQELGGASLSNRTLRMLERYTSVYLDCGGKQADAFDNGFAAILVPAYGEQLALLANREQGEKLSELLERMVGCERIPVTVAVLKAMNLM